MNTSTHHHLGDDLLNSWLDGAATDAEHRLVDEHIRTCDHCSEALESLAMVKQSLAALPEPALPRSFQLTPEQAAKPTPIRTAEPSTVVRLLPVARVLSIAAVLAFLIFGGATALGPGSTVFTGNDQVASDTTGTDGAAGALEETDADSAPPMAAAPVDIDEGEVVSQGDSATGSDTAARALDDMARARDTSPAGAEPNEGSRALTVATITAGIIAVAASALWFGLSRVNRQSTTT